MSRKIEDQMIAAIRAGKPFKSGNTSVAQEVDGTYVFLHGNLIAAIGSAKLGTAWTLAGWNTPTTRSRINALARAFNWRGVYNKDGMPRVSGADQTPILSTEWVNALD